MPSMPEDMEGFSGFGGFPGAEFNGTMPEGGKFDGTFPEGEGFPGGEGFFGWGEGQMPQRPENGEMPEFSGGDFGGMMPGFAGSFEGETKQIDISGARIAVEIDGGKESGSLENLMPGTFVTVTLDGKGVATYVLISQQPFGAIAK